MHLQLQIQDPSGEIRKYRLSSLQTLGRNQEADIPLRDATVPGWVGSLYLKQPAGDAVWFKAAENLPCAKLGDLSIREAHIPTDLPFTIGETRLRIVESEKFISALPNPPSGVKPWLSRSNSGRELLWNTKKAAETALSVYLAGETGTGKEVLAHLVHSWSSRKSGPFVPLHCSALSLSLVESELFGHVKGAFTGAIQQRPGALMQAHGGTLFLDEIGDLPLDIQVKLLRFLENGEIRPVGSDKIHRADVRLVCATHLSLSDLVEAGKFRRDLFYRLASITLQIPPLRERPEDIEYLSKTFASSHEKQISRAALHRLKIYEWPGNVRELQHAIDRASALAGAFEPILSEESFAFLSDTNALNGAGRTGSLPPMLSMHEMERHVLLNALKVTEGRREEAARILGVARSTLFMMMKRHKIIGPRVSRK